MSIVAILSLLAPALKLAKTYWPVITAVVVLVSKLLTGDQSGVSETVSMILAAWASVNSGAKTAKAVQSMDDKTVSVSVAPNASSPLPSPIINFTSPFRSAPDARPDHPLIR